MHTSKLFFVIAVFSVIGINGDDTILDSVKPPEEEIIPESVISDGIEDTKTKAEDNGNKEADEDPLVPPLVQENELPEEVKTENISEDVTTPSIKDISNQEITALSLETLGEENLDALNTLLVDNNKIETIDKEVLKNIPNLTHLSLKSNQLQHLETETFSEVTKLNELNLDKNPLVLPEDTHFLTTSSLRKFTMSECNLKMIRDDTFNGMTGLEELDIGKNPISEQTPLSKELFEPLSNLSKLVMPLGSSEELIKEVCKSHALLQKVCIDECNPSTDKLCDSQEPNETELKIVANSEAEETPEDLPEKKPSDVKPDEVSEDELKVKPLEETPTVQVEEQIPANGAEEKSTDSVSKASETLPDLPIRRIVPEIEPALENADETSNMMETDNKDTAIVRSIDVKKDDDVDKNAEPESSKSDVSSQSPNGPAIGVIIGVIIIIVMGIVIKKNWRKIKSKWSSNERSTPAPKSGQNFDRIRQPEEVPLKENNVDAANPV